MDYQLAQLAPGEKKITFFWHRFGGWKSCQWFQNWFKQYLFLNNWVTIQNVKFLTLWSSYRFMAGTILAPDACNKKWQKVVSFCYCRVDTSQHKMINLPQHPLVQLYSFRHLCLSPAIEMYVAKCNLVIIMILWD